MDNKSIWLSVWIALVFVILVVGVIVAAGYILLSPPPPDQALIPTLTLIPTPLPSSTSIPTSQPTLAPAPIAAPVIRTNTPARTSAPLASPTPIPATPVPATPTVPLVFGGWRGEYFDNRNLSGTARLVRDDGVINFNWETNSPASGIPSDGFSVRWTRTIDFDEGTYRFSTRVDDGERLWVDGDLVIDQWHDADGTLYTADRALAAGPHELRVEYYDNQRNALIQFWWDRIGDAPFWHGEYFDNPALSGTPAVIRSDPAINFTWGNSAPAPGINADSFSVRWTRRLDADAGTYRFTLTADDGARLFIDDNPVIDEWHDGSARDAAANYSLTKGSHILRLEYYERTGDATIRLRWEPVSTSNFSDWKGEYFSNKDLSGPPVLVRNDQAINFDWGGTAPGLGFPTENWSARWSRQIDFGPATYRFRIVADDGVRLYVDNNLIINQWHDSGGDPGYTVDLPLAGLHTVTLEYYEHAGSARAQLSIDTVATPTSTPSPTPSNTPTRTPTLTNTPTLTSTPSATPSQTQSSTPTFTLTPTRTTTPVSPTVTTATRTSTPTMTATFTRTATGTATYTATPTFTLTPTPTLSSTATLTPTPSLTAIVGVTITPPIPISYERTMSPDKVWIAAINSSTGGLDLVRNDGQVAPVFPAGPLGPVTWSPDSSRLLVVQVQRPSGVGSVLSVIGINTSIVVQVWQVRINSGHPSAPAMLLQFSFGDTVQAGEAHWGRWSPNSRFVLFWIGPSSVSAQADGLPLRLIDAESGQITTLETTLLNPQYQDWAADSSELAFTAGGNRSAQTNKWMDVYSPISATLTTIIRQTDQIPGILSWSPRGDWIAYAAINASESVTGTADSMSLRNPAISKRRIYLYNLDTGTHIRLAGKDTFQDAPEWSSDGKTLYYVQQDGNDIVLAASSPITGTPQLIQESRRPAPQSVGYFGQSNWSDLLAYRPDLARADVPALTESMIDEKTGLSIRFPGGWTKSTGWQTLGYECADCARISRLPHGEQVDLGPFSGNVELVMQSIDNPEGSAETALNRVLNSPGPGQFVGRSPLIAFASQRIEVNARPASRIETMDEFGIINHVVYIVSGKQVLVIRAQGDRRVFDAMAATVKVR